MLLSMGTDAKSAPRWVVFAYDIACPRRARLARVILAPHAGPRQYSVLECRMHYGWSRDLLAEVASVLSPAEDRLALWWPRDGLRVALQAAGHMTARAHADGAECAINRRRCEQLLGGAGNFLISYDVVCPKRAQRLHARVARGGAMLQKSVYQWRCPAAVIVRLLESCAPWVQPNDRFWVHPLRRISDLWHLGDAPTSLLPMATHHWNRAAD